MIEKVAKKNPAFEMRKYSITREPEILFLEYKRACGLVIFSEKPEGRKVSAKQP